MTSYREQQAKDRARFIRSIPDHRMTVNLDQGVFRSITMQKPHSSNLYFTITTIGGHLMVTGDMGSYTFCREHDMFGFFRESHDGNTCIDYRYWMEKCTASDKYSKMMIYNPDLLKDAAVRWFREIEFPEDRRMSIWADFRSNVLEYIGGDDEREDMQRVMDFSYERQERGSYTAHTKEYPFNDFYETHVTETSDCFKWICQAIAYTIKQYDLGGDKFTRQEVHNQQILRGKV